MRLSDVLSKVQQDKYIQVDGFLKQNLMKGKTRKIEVGKITLPFFCKRCDDILTFCSCDKSLNCIGVNKHEISIDSVLKCPRCNATIPVWFLIEFDEETEITALFPKVRIQKRVYKLNNEVCLSSEKYGKYSELLEKAECAYNEGLGSGAIMYLRKIYEQIVVETANYSHIKLLTDKNKRKSFSELLKEVDSRCSIVPSEFSDNRYRLFAELSDVIHGEYDEKLALKKYRAFYRLVVGILDKVKNNKEIIKVIKELEWNISGGKKVV